MQVPRKELTPEAVLGAGEFGQVLLASQRLAGGSTRKCAVKMLRGGAASADANLFCREVRTQHYPIQLIVITLPHVYSYRHTT
jgi:hypothetical protein